MKKGKNNSPVMAIPVVAAVMDSLAFSGCFDTGFFTDADEAFSESVGGYANKTY